MAKQDNGKAKKDYTKDSTSVAKNYPIFSNPNSTPKAAIAAENKLQDVVSKRGVSNVGTMGPAGEKLAKSIPKDHIETKKYGGSKTNDGDTLNHFSNVRDARVKEIQKIQAPKAGEVAEIKTNSGKTVKMKPAVKKMGGSNKAC